MARNTLAPGGYIGGEPPRRPYFNQLSGAWKLEDVLDRKKADTWANPTSIEDLFSTWLYTGNGGTQTITNGIDLANNEGMVWIKRRDNVPPHCLYDTIRGAGKRVETNTTDAQLSTNNNLSSFNSNGFTTQQGGDTNGAGNPYASWTFRTAPKFFDVVTYTGTGVNRTIAHNLGSVPGCIFVKRLDALSDWQVYHRSLANTEYMVLNSTAAKVTDAARWNSTTPTSTEFSLGTDATVNASGGTYVAYLFAHDAGGFGDSGNESVIKCGSYTGTGSTLAIELGWEPQWVLIKRTNSSTNSDWNLFDSMRGMPTVADGATNGNSAELNPNLSNAESAIEDIHPYATGFRITSASAQMAGNGDTYIYIAIRRGPMKAPTDATKVFSAVSQNGGGTVTTGIPIDMLIAKTRASIGDNLFVDRLRGQSLSSASNASNAEAAAIFSLDRSTGFLDGQLSSATAIYYSFRRTPGFFDVVAYTGTGSPRTVAHNLGVAPELVIVKRRDSGSDWIVLSTALGKYGQLNATSAINGTGLTYFGDGTSYIAPTSTEFFVATNASVNSGTLIAYLFASCPGVSKVGIYTGTGTTLDIDCGFSSGARFVLIKRTDVSGEWHVWDSARGIVSGDDPFYYLNRSGPEATNNDYIDPLNSGFQISSAATPAINESGGTFLFMAIA